MMRLLLSYYYYGSADLDQTLAGFKAPLDLFADSGAYSAETIGVPIAVDDYAAWIDREGWRFTTYVNLDVIGDAEATWRNQQRMEALGLAPVPAFHGGEPWEYFERYCDRYPYVALGGMVARDRMAAMRWCIRCFKTARATGTKLHGFGQTRIFFLRSLPWYSVDSSSWASAHMYGGVMLWDDKLINFRKIPLHDHDAAYRHAALIRAHGGDPAEVAHPQAGLVDRNDPDADHWREVRTRIIAMNAVAWMRFEAWLRRHHQAIDPPTGYETKIYLATGRWGADIGRGLCLAEDQDDTHGPKVFLATGFVLNVDGERQGLEEASDMDGGPKVYLVQPEPSSARATIDPLREIGGDDGKLSEISKYMTNPGKENPA
jgi:hypothetical protein